MSSSAFDGRKNNFDFIRLTLAGLVLYSHCYYLIDPSTQDPLLRATRQIWFGGLAVDWFFVISGFLIVASWLKSKNPADYFRKRVARIYPAYLVVCVLCISLFGPLGASSAVSYWRSCQWGRWALSTVLLGYASIPHAFSSQAVHLVNASLWTIRYEFICYIGVAVLGMLGILRHRAVFASLVALIFAESCLAGFLHRSLFPTGSFWAMSLPDLFRFMMYFGAGACVFSFRDRIPLSMPWFCLALSLLVVSALIHKAMYILLPTCGTYVLFYAAFNSRWTLHSFARLGDFSYGTYLYAWPIEQLCLRYMSWARTPWRLFIVAFPLTLLAAAGSWFIIERPALRWGHSRRIAQYGVAPTAATSVV